MKLYYSQLKKDILSTEDLILVPIFPIYGFGAVIIMIVISKFIAEPDESNKFSMRPLKIFILILVLFYCC